MMLAGFRRTEMWYEASLQPSRNAVLRGACKTRENGRAKRREGIRSAKIKNSTARFKTRSGAARGVLLSGADRAPLSEGGRDARGRKGEVGESLRERGGCRDRETPASLTCSRQELPHGRGQQDLRAGRRRPPRSVPGSGSVAPPRAGRCLLPPRGAG